MIMKIKQPMSFKLFISNLLKLLIINIIKIYQRFISPFFPSSCKFSPSCSRYGIEAINKHGAIRGSYLTVKRVLKCNPWNNGGYDPIP
jgi:putative membrane protein insertion efficiency factor